MMLEPLRVIRLYSWIGAARIRVIRFSFAYWCRVRKRPEVRLRGIIIKYGAKKKNDSKEKEEESGRKKNKRYDSAKKQSIACLRLSVSRSLSFSCSRHGENQGLSGHSSIACLTRFWGWIFYASSFAPSFGHRILPRDAPRNRGDAPYRQRAFFSRDSVGSRSFSKWIRRTHRKIRFRSPSFHCLIHMRHFYF